jgi:hypothetical protein
MARSGDTISAVKRVAAVAALAGALLPVAPVPAMATPAVQPSATITTSPGHSRATQPPNTFVGPSQALVSGSVDYLNGWITLTATTLAYAAPTTWGPERALDWDLEVPPGAPGAPAGVAGYSLGIFTTSTGEVQSGLEVDHSDGSGSTDITTCPYTVAWGASFGYAATLPASCIGIASLQWVISFGGHEFNDALPEPPTKVPVIAAAIPSGYWLTARDGGVFSFGDARFLGSLGSLVLNKPIVAAAATHDRGGYWQAGADGGVFAFGDARFFGSTGGLTLNRPVVTLIPTADGAGYWLIASDGGVFAFGDATFHGSLGALVLNQPIVAGFATPDDRGYTLVAADGGVFGFGDATFYGSLTGLRLNAPIVAAFPTADGAGYTLVGADGGVFSFGDAIWRGSLASRPLAAPIVSAEASAEGYRLTGSDGSVSTFGADANGSLDGVTLNQPVVSIIPAD